MANSVIQKSLTSEVNELSNRGYVVTQWVNCTYYTSGQLQGAYTIPTVPTGYAVRLLCVSNTIENNEIGAKCTGKFLASSGTNIRILGNGFTSTDTMTVLVAFFVFKQ